MFSYKFLTYKLSPYFAFLVAVILIISASWFFRGQLSIVNWYRPIILFLGAVLGILFFEIDSIPLKQAWFQLVFLAFSLWFIISTNFNLSWGLVLGIGLRLWKDNFASVHFWAFTLGLVLLVMAMIL